MIGDREHVARVVFEPKMIYHGLLMDAAFELRSQISENYISVLRMAVDSWKQDMAKIPTRKNRRIYGYADMIVGDIRAINIKQVSFDVMAVDNASMTSHAGIFIKAYGEDLVGGKTVGNLPEGISEDFLRLAIRKRLIELARKNIVSISNSFPS